MIFLAVNTGNNSAIQIFNDCSDEFIDFSFDLKSVEIYII